MNRGNGSGGWRSNLSGLRARLRRHPRLWIFIGVPLAIILVIAYAIASLIDEPLRRYTEAVAAFREALRLRPEFPDAQANLARALTMIKTSP